MTEEFGDAVARAAVEEGIVPFREGQRVLKYTGDYQAEGQVRSVFTTRRGKLRYVVEHDQGMLHIYSHKNLKALHGL